MCPSAPRVCSEPGAQKPVLSLSLDLIVLRWISLDLSDDKSTLVQVMAWCRQAKSHYLSQCWPRSLSPYGVIRPQWVNKSVLVWTWCCAADKTMHGLTYKFAVITTFYYKVFNNKYKNSMHIMCKHIQTNKPVHTWPQSNPQVNIHSFSWSIYQHYRKKIVTLQH